MAGKDFCRLFDKRGMTRHEAKPQHVVQHAEKANAQIGTFGFAETQAKRKKPKEPIFLPTLGQTNNETNEIYIEKRDKRKI
jgi:hypothetical protein